MGIVLIGGEKGGTGKTTLATNLAAMLALQGKMFCLWIRTAREPHLSGQPFEKRRKRKHGSHVYRNLEKEWPRKYGIWPNDMMK